MGKLQEYVQRIYFNYHKAMANYNETNLTSDSSEYLSMDHQAIVWMYGKMETLTKLSESRKTKIKEQIAEMDTLELKVRDLERTLSEVAKNNHQLDDNLSTCRKHNERLNDKLTLRSLTLEDRTKDLKNKTEDLEELQSIYEDHKRFLKYMVVMSIFAGFMMGLVSYPLI